MDAYRPYRFSSASSASPEDLLENPHKEIELEEPTGTAQQLGFGNGINTAPNHTDVNLGDLHRTKDQTYLNNSDGDDLDDDRSASDNHDTPGNSSGSYDATHGVVDDTDYGPHVAVLTVGDATDPYSDQHAPTDQDTSSRNLQDMWSPGHQEGHAKIVYADASTFDGSEMSTGFLRLTRRSKENVILADIGTSTTDHDEVHDENNMLTSFGPPETVQPAVPIPSHVTQSHGDHDHVKQRNVDLNDVSLRLQHRSKTDTVLSKPSSPKLNWRFCFTLTTLIFVVMLVLLALLFLMFTRASSFNQSYHNPKCAEGRHVIVHLFEWKWTDVALECERFLGPKGFCGVQVSPPNEHRVITDPSYPWWQRYQPVSYLLHSRSGNKTQFRDMVDRCNAVGVRIYVDVVINHMGGHKGIGSAGSSFDSNRLLFPAVPFGPNDFSCCECDACKTASCNIESYSDAQQVRNCRLLGLIDLALARDEVRRKVAGYLNQLIDIGVGGFRVDAAKHMWPDDMKTLFASLHNLNTKWFPIGSRPFVAMEVIDNGEHEPIRASEYIQLGRVTEFKYGAHLGKAFQKRYPLKDLKTFGTSWGMLESKDSLVFIDNHDNQRGHGGGGDVLSFYSPRQYKMAVAFMLAHPHGVPRLMSSYSWDGGPADNDWMGPPANTEGRTKDITITKGQCDDRWVCEHRWPQIVLMVAFRNEVDGTSIDNWWDNGGHQIAFSRGNKGFLAINNENFDMNVRIKTGLPAGKYCDIMYGYPTDYGCSGSTVVVDSEGFVNVQIGTTLVDPMLAIHTGAMYGTGSSSTDYEIDFPSPLPSTPGPTRKPGEGDFQRTVIFLEGTTVMGQNLFIRGGIAHDKREGCTGEASTSACAITIKQNSLGGSAHYGPYRDWGRGDNFLDWYGVESTQGMYSGEAASGTPCAWTTNDVTHDGHQPLNVYGEHYWMTDLNMDCSETEDGWFELKGYITNSDNNWEGNIEQVDSCEGAASGSRPYSMGNHMARCGYINVFRWNDNGCRIETFS
ncbi:unnamed protein product [Owenia fusiformis]|uniref:alpha-amylase n=1 Tax=Owenia fusiformis TaxID=6347 RepID=A0A8S4Q294_OWEFU|nr:unnamed protein product [Owenia fusiformis]